MRTVSIASNSRNSAATAAELPCSSRVKRPGPPVVPGPVAKRSSAGLRPASMTTKSSNVSPSVRSCAGTTRRGVVGRGASARSPVRVGLDVDLEAAAAPAEAEPDAGRELLLGPAFARADERRSAASSSTVHGPSEKNRRSCAAGAVDERDRHPAERRARDALDRGWRQPRAGDARRARIAVLGPRRIVRALRPEPSDRRATSRSTR